MSRVAIKPFLWVLHVYFNRTVSDAPRRVTIFQQEFIIADGVICELPSAIYTRCQCYQTFLSFMSIQNKLEYLSLAGIFNQF